MEEKLYHFLLLQNTLIFQSDYHTFLSEDIFVLHRHSVSNVKIVTKELVEKLDDLSLLIECGKMDWVPIRSFNDDRPIAFRNFLSKRSWNLTKCFALDAPHLQNVLDLQIKFVNNRPERENISVYGCYDELFQKFWRPIPR